MKLCRYIVSDFFHSSLYLWDSCSFKLFTLIFVYNFFVWLHHSAFIYPSVDEHLAYFQFRLLEEFCYPYKCVFGETHRHINTARNTFFFRYVSSNRITFPWWLLKLNRSSDVYWPLGIHMFEVTIITLLFFIILLTNSQEIIV